MRKRIICSALSTALILGLCAPAYAATTTATQPAAVVTAALKDGVLQFSELDSCVKNGNSSLLSCTESLASLNTVNRESVVKSLKSADNALTNAIWYFSLNGSDTSGLRSQQSSIEQQLDDYTKENYAKTYNGSVLQINGGINQIVKASESLYFGVVKMDYSMTSIQRSLDALGRTVTTTAVRVRLGQSSQEDLRALQDQYTEVKSQLTALQTQSKSSKQSLQSMIGVTPDGSLKLAVPDAIADATITAIDLSSDTTAGKAASADLYQKQQAVDDAKDDLDDMPFSPLKQHTYQQALYTLEAAKSSFEVQATTLYQSVLENQRLYKVATVSLTGAQKTYTIAQKKYSLGMISKQDLLNAQDTLTTAKQAVDQAVLDLGSAYASYQWVRLGIAAA